MFKAAVVICAISAAVSPKLPATLVPKLIGRATLEVKSDTELEPARLPTSTTSAAVMLTLAPLIDPPALSTVNVPLAFPSESAVTEIFADDVMSAAAPLKVTEPGALMEMLPVLELIGLCAKNVDEPELVTKEMVPAPVADTGAETVKGPPAVTLTLPLTA